MDPIIFVNIFLAPDASMHKWLFQWDDSKSFTGNDCFTIHFEKGYSGFIFLCIWLESLVFSVELPLINWFIDIASTVGLPHKQHLGNPSTFPIFSEILDAKNVSNPPKKSKSHGTGGVYRELLSASLRRCTLSTSQDPFLAEAWHWNSRTSIAVSASLFFGGIGDI